MNCKTVQRQIIEMLDRKDDRQIDQNLAAHLKSCPDCASQYDEAKRTLETITPTQPIRASHNFKERVMSEIISIEQTFDSRRDNRTLHLWYMKPAFVGTILVLFLLSILVLDVWEPWNRSTSEKQAGFALIHQALANETAFFQQDGIVHIVNEISIPAMSNEHLSKARWVPMTSIDHTGKVHYNQLQVGAKPGEAYSVLDEVWYEKSTGRFARILSLYGRAIHATAYNGLSVYSIQSRNDGNREIVGQLVTESFKVPENPGEILGFSIGLKNQFKNERPFPVEELDDETLDDGTILKVLKVSMGKQSEFIDSSMILKIDKEKGTLVSQEILVDGSPMITQRHISHETVTQADIEWDLSDIDIEQKPAVGSFSPTVMKDMVNEDVSVAHIAKASKRTVYICEENPAWTQKRVITDVADIVSPPNRMAIIAYLAENSKHVILIQAETYNKAFGGLVPRCNLQYTAPNGIKLYECAPLQKMSSMLLQSAYAVTKEKPSKDATCYLLETPDKTYPVLAINGTVSDSELHSVVDLLVSAEE
jgi:hypothetical protein